MARPPRRLRYLARAALGNPPRAQTVWEAPPEGSARGSAWREDFRICLETRDVYAEAWQGLAETSGAGQEAKTTGGVCGEDRDREACIFLVESACLTQDSSYSVK